MSTHITHLSLLIFFPLKKNHEECEIQKNTVVSLQVFVYFLWMLIFEIAVGTSYE